MRARRNGTNKVAALCACIGLVALSMPLSAGPAAAQHRVKLNNAEIVRNFDEIALRNEHRRLRNPRITKWRAPLRVYIRAEVGPGRFAREDLKKQFARTGASLGRIKSWMGHFPTPDLQLAFVMDNAGPLMAAAGGSLMTGSLTWTNWVSLSLRPPSSVTVRVTW